MLVRASVVTVDHRCHDGWAGSDPEVLGDLKWQKHAGDNASLLFNNSFTDPSFHTDSAIGAKETLWEGYEAGVEHPEYWHNTLGLKRHEFEALEVEMLPKIKVLNKYGDKIADSTKDYEENNW